MMISNPLVHLLSIFAEIHKVLALRQTAWNNRLAMNLVIASLLAMIGLSLTAQTCPADGVQAGIVRANGVQVSGAQEGGEAGSFFLLPRELFESSFPQGAQYRIPEDPRVSPMVRRGKAYESKGQWKAAANIYALAYKRAGKGEAAPYILFKQCTLLEDLDQSSKGLRDLLQAFPHFALIDAVRFELAKLLFLQRQYEEASIILGDVGNGALAPYASAFRGELYFRLGRYDESLEAYERSREGLVAVEETPEETFIVRCYFGIAQSLIGKGGGTGLRSAEELLKRIAGSSSYPLYQGEALVLLGDLYEGAERYGIAYAAYGEILKRFPNTLSALRAGERIRGFGQKESGSKPVALDLLFDEALLRGAYRIAPDGSITLAGHPQESPQGTLGEESAGRDYSVQIGSFGKKENAENMAREIAEKGFSGFLSEAAVGGKTLYRVKVGPYETLPKAEEAKKQLGALGYPGFVVLER